MSRRMTGITRLASLLPTYTVTKAPCLPGIYLGHVLHLCAYFQTSLPGFLTEIDDRVLATTQELAEFPFNEDFNSGNPLGVCECHNA